VAISKKNLSGMLFLKHASSGTRLDASHYRLRSSDDAAPA
jgi:hypothetical protein